MVSHGEMLCIARRYDTVVARAFLRALGIGAADVRPRRRRGRGGNAHRKLERSRYRGWRECFENRGTSPMDWH